jgi:imidazolonepropionase-like amidohydrolase
MKKLLVLGCLVAAVSWNAGRGSGVIAQAPAPGGPLIITNARIVDGTGRIIPRGTVVARDGKIVSVGEASVTVAGAQQIDARGMTVLPGYIDGHRHIGAGSATWLEREGPAQMREFLDAGFTTVLSAGDGGEQIPEMRRRLAAGEVVGPTLIINARVGLAGRAGGAGPGGPPAAGAPPAGGRGDGRAAGDGGQAGRGGFGGRGDPARFDNARPPLRPTTTAPAIPEAMTRAAVQAAAKQGYDGIKTNITVTPNGPEQTTLAIVADEARRLGLRSITHAVTVVDTLAAVRAKTDVLVHTPHIGRLDDDPAAVEEIAKAGIPMMSTLAIFVPRFIGSDNTPTFRDLLPFPWETLSSAGQGPVNARLLWNAGITYGYGTDTSYTPRESLIHELIPLQLVFSPQDIVRILTRNSAIAVGRGDTIGTLEAGKQADIVIVDGDPIVDTDALLNVRLVVKGGRVVVDKR